MGSNRSNLVPNVVRSMIAGTAAWCASLITAAADEPNFVAETIDDRVTIGYGVAAGDVDGDGRTDLILADAKAFVWYRNPDWTRFEIVKDLTPLDNVCIAARDIDGDGKVEIAVGAMWNPSDTVDSGSVHYLVPQEDRTLPWTAVRLPHEPTVHRMRWLRRASGDFVLVVAPLHGRENRNGEGKPVRILAYEPPKSPQGEWKLDEIDASMHMTHNIDPYVDASADGEGSESLLIVGREGVRRARWRDGAWQSEAIERISGGGEVRLGRSSDGRAWLATIEPMHGDRLAVYPLADRAAAERWQATDRIELDAAFAGGHAIAVGDLLGIGEDQIVAGWRLPNAAGEIGLKLYRRDAAGVWSDHWIDRNGMATEDAIVVDLDDDGDLDIVAAGRLTNNLKLYRNQRQ